MLKLTKCINDIRLLLIDPRFINAHKVTPKDFVRARLLTCSIILMLILRKIVKSLKISLNKLFMNKYIKLPVNASAYSQVRKKFKHTAFIALDQSIVSNFYSDDDIKRWNGFRCIAVDGSKLTLPNSANIGEEYGSIATMSGTCSQALFECYYDLLNHIAIHCKLAHGLSHEVELAIAMLDCTTEKDLLIYDRGYASYEFLATLTQQSKNYLIRCPKSSFKTIQLLNNSKRWSEIVTLKCPSGQRKNIREKNLPFEIRVRFITVILSTGELGILLTSLMNTEINRDEFRWLYGMRWGGATFYSRLKGRLCLENFTGKTAESVKQDFWSTIFISNFETIAKEGVEEEMNQSTRSVHEKKVKTAVSFNVIKNRVFEIFFSNSSQEDAVQKMKLLFKTNPVLQRSEHESSSSPPRNTSALRSNNFLQRIKKMIF